MGKLEQLQIIEKQGKKFKVFAQIDIDENGIYIGDHEKHLICFTTSQFKEIIKKFNKVHNTQ